MADTTMLKKIKRERRSKRTRASISRLSKTRLCVHRTPRHIYAQIISAEGGKVLASASSLDKTVKTTVKNTGNIETAAIVGKMIAERAKAAGITEIAFDRSGFLYHGRVKALADAARSAGLVF